MKKNKIVHLITGLNVGGAEKVVFDLALELNKRGYENLVVGISEKDFLAKMFKEAGITVEILNVDKKISSFIKGLMAFYKLIKKNDIKIIHAHMTHALIMAVCVKFFIPSIKIVFTSHSFNVGSKMRENIIMFLKPFRNVDIIFSAKMQKKMYRKNTVIIPNGINTALYKIGVPKNEIFTFLSIGRIETVKNHIFLVDIAEKLQSEFNFEIHIVGEGILKEELVAYLDEKKVSHIFKLLGYRSDVNVICNQSHAFVLPSLWEGLPISLLEAGASSLPVIVTPVGSIPELIDDTNGYLAELTLFAEKMKLVYSNYPEAVRKGKALQQTIENQYDLNRIAEKHIEIYKSL
jgi:glycosyltransferase involved in cell wall biosynthesis